MLLGHKLLYSLIQIKLGTLAGAKYCWFLIVLVSILSWEETVLWSRSWEVGNGLFTGCPTKILPMEQKLEVGGGGDWCFGYHHCPVYIFPSIKLGEMASVDIHRLPKTKTKTWYSSRKLGVVGATTRTAELTRTALLQYRAVREWKAVIRGHWLFPHSLAVRP